MNRWYAVHEMLQKQEKEGSWVNQEEEELGREYLYYDRRRREVSLCMSPHTFPYFPFRSIQFPSAVHFSLHPIYTHVILSPHYPFLSHSNIKWYQSSLDTWISFSRFSSERKKGGAKTVPLCGWFLACETDFSFKLSPYYFLCLTFLWIQWLGSFYRVLVLIQPPWRNRLARSAVNRKVGGSNPPGGEISFFPFFLTSTLISILSLMHHVLPFNHWQITIKIPSFHVTCFLSFKDMTRHNDLDKRYSVQ